MKNVLKKVIASAMAVASLTISAAGINVNATDTSALGSTETAISENPTRSDFPFYLTNQAESYLTYYNGKKTVYYTASVNQGGVTIIVKDSSGNEKGRAYFSASYAPTASINIPAGSTYYFYAYSSTASPSYVISGTAHIN